MKGLLALLLLLLMQAPARAEGTDALIDSLDVSSWQQAAGEAGAELDAIGMIRALASGELRFTPGELAEVLKEIVLGEAGGAFHQLTAYMGPALLWAVNRFLLRGNRLGEAAGQACALTGMGVMIAVFSGHMALAADTVGRLGRLTGQVFPVLTGLMSASGSPGAAGAVQQMVIFGGGALTDFLQRAMQMLCGGAAALAAAGNLTGRIRLEGLFRLCRSAGNWLFGGIMAVFLGMTAMSGVMGGAQDSVTVRAAKFAVDSLLPVVGGDVADAMDGMVKSAALVKSAAGVTGVMVMLAVSLRPVVRLALGMLMCRLASALTEPVAEGPLSRCAAQLGEATQMLLAAVAVSAAMFMTLTGVCLSLR